MKIVELTLPELQVWLTQKLEWKTESVLDLLVSVATQTSRRYKPVDLFSCVCGGRMHTRQDSAGDFHVKIFHDDACGLVGPVETNLYAIFYSVNQSGMWTPWAYEAIVPFGDLHTYVNGERVKYTVHPLPAIKQEDLVTPDEDDARQLREIDAIATI